MDLLEPMTFAKLFPMNLPPIFAEDVNTIYIDMDDTLFDFHGQLELETGKSARNGTDTQFWELFNANPHGAQGFFSRLKPFPMHAVFLQYIVRTAYAYGYEVRFLSALSINNDETMDEQRKGKDISLANWVYAYGFDIPAIYTNSSAEKKEFAGPRDILIDDLESNINNWRTAGGSGILHKNFEQSMNELRVTLEVLSE